MLHAKNLESDVGDVWMHSTVLAGLELNIPQQSEMRLGLYGVTPRTQSQMFALGRAPGPTSPSVVVARIWLPP